MILILVGCFEIETVTFKGHFYFYTFIKTRGTGSCSAIQLLLRGEKTIVGEVK